jgi:hypothetical protein
MKMEIVMPAWIAGIQIRKDASGDIHVSLDSSAPYWNDRIVRFCSVGKGFYTPGLILIRIVESATRESAHFNKVS